MLKFGRCAEIPHGALEKLIQVVGPMTTFDRAVLGSAVIPGDSQPTPVLVVECKDLRYRPDANLIAEAMRPYFAKYGVFNVAPTPPGPWWEQLQRIGVVVRSSGRASIATQ